MILLLAWLSSAAPVAVHGAGVASEAPPLSEPVRWMGRSPFDQRLRRAERLRNAGAVAALSGPPVAFGGLLLVLGANCGDCRSAPQLGFPAVFLGLSAMATGPALLFGSGATAAPLARRVQGRAPGRVLRWVSLAFAALGAAGVQADPNSFAGVIVGATAYTGSVGCAWRAANVDLRAARRSLPGGDPTAASAPWWAGLDAIAVAPTHDPTRAAARPVAP